ncbi:Zinc finger protein [Plakobranchus ocellatus]|uniref:Zinc finger protein n=1 Tax=Plakobranchus ocellatus TaxID=259542 RepID=A0AAV3Z578_9GAST|nr:Zinc finger protein [Plakobranchus ocellatus]
MKWKGPFDILVTVCANDYRINVNEKEKTFHANLLKSYITRDTASDETSTGDNSVQAVSLAVVEDEGSGWDECGCVALPEFGGWSSKETVKDLNFGDYLSAEQRRELEELAGCFLFIFSDCPGSTTLEEHRIELTSSTPCGNARIQWVTTL